MCGLRKATKHGVAPTPELVPARTQDTWDHTGPTLPRPFMTWKHSEAKKTTAEGNGKSGKASN